MPLSSPANKTAELAGRLMEMSFAHSHSRLLWTSVELGIYKALAAGQTTVREIAETVRASERGVRMLLDALVALEVLGKENGSYQISREAAELLVPSSPDYLGGILQSGGIEELWHNLPESVRSGKPAARVETQETGETFFPPLVQALHVAHRERARQLAKAIEAGERRRGLRVVDVGCGSGVWGIAVAQADPESRVTAQDFPAVLELTRGYAERHGVADQFEYLPGDLKAVDFGENRFDLAILGNIVHSEGERSSKGLFGRLYRALRPKGQVAILDMVPDDDRTGPAFPLVFALTMLLHTEDGDCFTLAEYTQWLKEAGFSAVQTAEIDRHSPAILARKG